jgi:serine/threonine protein kinase
VKPSNILFDAQDHAVLADFGLAKMLESELDTGSGSVSGTPAYMSPEQAMGHKLDGRSDLYSLGVVAYEALVGQPPFQSRNVIQLAMKHVNEPPPRPREIRPEISNAVEESILKVLAKDRNTRYATAGEFLQALSSAAYLSRDFWRPARHGHGTEVAPEPEPAPPPPAPSPVTPVLAQPAAEAPAMATPEVEGSLSPRMGDTLLPMDNATLAGDPYTEIATPAGVDPFDIPDATQIADSQPPQAGPKPKVVQPSASNDPYTQIAVVPGIDPFDVPDPTYVGPPAKPEPDEDGEQPPTLV